MKSGAVNGNKALPGPYPALLAALVVFTAFIRVLFILKGGMDLSPEEAQYWLWSEHLDIGYYSKGPAIAYIIALFTSIFGDTELGVRFGAVFISAIVTALTYLFTVRLFEDHRAAFLSALVLNITPLFTAGSVIMTTDTPLVLCWGLSLYALYVSVKHGKTGYWVLTGIFAGLGLLTKFTMMFIYPVALLFLLLSPQDRRWLKRKEPYIALFVSLLFFIPTILWNIGNDWVTFKHVLGQTHVNEVRHAGFAAGFILSQIGIITPFIFLGMAYGLYRAAVEGIKRKSREFILLFLASAPVLAFFIAKSFHSKIQANWAAFAYLGAAIAGVTAITMALEKMRQPGRRVLLKLFIFVSLASGSIITAATYYPWAIEKAGIHFGSKHPLDSVLGWNTVGQRADAIYRKMAPENGTFVFSDRYQIAAELAFYMPSKPRTYNINVGRRMNQFDLWEGFYDFKGQNGIYVQGHGDGPEEAVRRVFKSCDGGESVPVVHNSAVLKTYYIYRCYEFKGMEKPSFENW